MGVGRPIPTGGSLGAAGILDGNRTDVESSLNQLEGFLRGMSDRQFIMSLVTAPLSPADMTLAWNNCSRMLSDVRSEQQGSRSFTAGVALPLSMGHSASDSAGTTHSSGSSTGVSESAGVSTTLTDAISASESAGANTAATQGTSESLGATQTVGTSTSQSTAEGNTVGESFSYSQTTGTSESAAAGQNATLTETLNESVAATQSATQGTSTSVSDGSSAGNNWNSSAGTSSSGTTSNATGITNTGTTTDGTNISSGTTLNHSISDTDTSGTSEGNTTGVSGGGAGFPGGLSSSSTSGTSEAHADGATEGYSNTNTVTGTNTVSSATGTTESLTNSSTEGITVTDTTGGNIGQSHTVGAGTNQSSTHGTTQTTGQSIAAAQGQTLTNTTGTSSSNTVGHTTNASQSTTQTSGTGTSQSASSSQTAGTSQSASQGTTRSTTTGTSQSAAQGRTSSTGANQALTDSYAVAMTRAQASVSTLGAVPSVGVSVNRATFDEGKRSLGDMLEAQQKRFVEGIESGAMLYQLSIVCPDRQTLLAAAGLAKSSFWGPGNEKQRLVMPFETQVDFEDDERIRLVDHARVFTLDRKRHPVSETVEPYRWSSFVTTHEAAAFCHPPTAESSGIKAVHDSMPVFSQPADRQNKEIRLGRIFNGERARVTEIPFGVDTSDIKGHILVAGQTGSGKTNTTMRILEDLARIERDVTPTPTIDNPNPAKESVKAGILAIDWMENMRDLAGVVSEDRFKFFSVTRPQLGQLAFNPLALPDPKTISVSDWLGDVADNMAVSFNLGEFGRSLIAEKLFMLFNANRLEDFELARAKINPTDGSVLRPAITLPAIDPSTLPAGVDAVQISAEGDAYANCFTCPDLTRLVGMEHLAAIVMGFVDELASPEGARQYGTSMRDRAQSLWRRLSYFATGSPFQDKGIISHDERLDEPTCTKITDIVDPKRGLVTVIESDGLDLANRRFIIGSLLLGVWRYGLSQGKGFFDQDGEGPGLYVALEEAHEIFGDAEAQEDTHTQATRTQLYETMFRRARALGMHLITLVQNAGSVPEAVTSNSGTVILHRQTAEADRKVAFSLMNWKDGLGQQQAEWKWLGMQPTGDALVRLTPHDDYLEAAPVHVKVDESNLRTATDEQLQELFDRRNK